MGADRDTEDKTTTVATEKEEDAENGRTQEEEKEDEGEGPELALRVISVKILSFFMYILWNSYLTRINYSVFKFFCDL